MPEPAAGRVSALVGMDLAASGVVLNLCFHGIGAPRRVLEPDEERFWVKESQFDEMLDTVADDPAVRISFDDANASDIATALPHLSRRGLSATFFVIAGRIGRPGSLSRGDLQELVAAGMTIGAHGMHHRPWRTATDRELHQEIDEAPRVIADAAGTAVDRFACPHGSYDRRVLRALRHHGAARVYTVDGGAARADGWLQSRYVVERTDTAESLAALGRNPHGTSMTRTLRSLKCAVKRLR